MTDDPVPPWLGSAPLFRQEFEHGLENLLRLGGLNLFILVCANTSFERGLFNRFEDRLRSAYRSLRDDLQSRLQAGASIDEADDDLLVFLKIACIGFDSLYLTERRMAGPWEIQFNHLRSFRPLRNSQEPVSSIHKLFDPRGFHFNKLFMQQETIWSGTLLGRSVDLYYNKYPFVESHCLLVPERQDCMPQYLTREIHDYVWTLLDALGDGLPDLRIGYNALGAFASVNHLHLQLFLRERNLPVEDQRWQHNGGTDQYPLRCRVFHEASEAWAFIEKLHQRDLTYNILFTPQRLYCMPRKKQGEFPLVDWSNGFSWYEVCGGMITFNRQDYANLQAVQTAHELELAALDEENE